MTVQLDLEVGEMTLQGSLGLGESLEWYIWAALVTLYP